MNKILIVGPAWVGDMVMTQSLFKVIKNRDKTAVIDVLALDWGRAILSCMPEVRHNHTMTIGQGVLGLKERYRLAQGLKPHQYDQAIIIPNSWKSALIPWFAGIPKRTGFFGECRFGLLNDMRYLDKNRLTRQVDRFAILGYDQGESFNNAGLPLPSLIINESKRQETISKFAIKIDPKQPILAISPGAAGGTAKRWPESYFAKVAVKKLQEGWSVWLLGANSDAALSAHIQSATQNRCVDFTGKTQLGEAIDLLSLSTTVVANDSGLMHVAAALAKPVVAVYGPTDSNFAPPLYKKSKSVQLSLPCSPCAKRECPLKHHQCMLGLQPEQILHAIDALAV